MKFNISENIQNNERDTFFYAIDKNNRQIMLLSLLSLLQSSNRVGKKIQVCILSRGDELFDLLQLDFSVLEKKFPEHKLDIKKIVAGDINHIPIEKNTRPVSSYLRLLVPSLSKDVFNKVMYLDADTIIKEYPHFIHMGDHAVAALHEDIAGVHRFKYRYNTSIKGYFNSGVMFYDIDKFLSENLSDRAYNFLHKHNTLYPDQDALNYACKDIGIAELEKGYNILPRRYDSIQKEKQHVLHYAGKKPREKGQRIPSEYLSIFNRLQEDIYSILDTQYGSTISISEEINCLEKYLDYTKKIAKVTLGDLYYLLLNLKRDSYEYGVSGIIKEWPGFSEK